LIRDLNLAEPAQRALAEAGIVTLQDVSNRSIRDLLALHGVGPKTIRQLTPFLEEAGLSFKQ
jgi:DNA-directed RNA polymerase alpha subunit